METRVLTLFDDEDFYPKEEPKKKPKKEPITAKAVERENVMQQPEVQESELNAGIVTPEEHSSQEPGTEQETFNEVVETISVQEPEHAEVDSPGEIIDEPKNEFPEEEEQPEIIAENTDAEQLTEEWVEEDFIESSDDVFNEAVAFEEPLPEIEADEDNEAGINADDEELNKQILSELVQVDYASLIHRDYPFDINNASVVGKNAVTTSKEEPVLQEELSDEEEDNEVFEDIVPLPEWKLDKKYYTIGEVAQLFTVNTSHIRFWTNEFKLKPRTTRKGDRLYSPKDIAELRLIHHLVKEKKHTIKGAREKLKAKKSDVHSKLDLKDSLINLRDTLIKIKEQL
jgi:DNA-binding transcriptional MerR regulator